MTCYNCLFFRVLFSRYSSFIRPVLSQISLPAIWHVVCICISFRFLFANGRPPVIFDHLVCKYDDQ